MALPPADSMSSEQLGRAAMHMARQGEASAVPYGGGPGGMENIVEKRWIFMELQRIFVAI